VGKVSKVSLIQYI